jgi:hypothetical protein
MSGPEASELGEHEQQLPDLLVPSHVSEGLRYSGLSPDNIDENTRILCHGLDSQDMWRELHALRKIELETIQYYNGAVELQRQLDHLRNRFEALYEQNLLNEIHSLNDFLQTRAGILVVTPIEQGGVLQSVITHPAEDGRPELIGIYKSKQHKITQQTDVYIQTSALTTQERQAIKNYRIAVGVQ